jgi:hypothetical protein
MRFLIAITLDKNEQRPIRLYDAGVGRCAGNATPLRSCTSAHAPRIDADYCLVADCKPCQR